MATLLTFRRGEFQRLVATRTFSLGNTGVSIQRGAEVLFDGGVVDYGGVQSPAPQLIGAHRAGWVVVPEEYDENASAVRQSANIQVRHATKGGNPMMPEAQQRTAISTTEQDERYVGDIGAHSKAAQQRNAAPRGTAPPGMRVSSMDQDGVPVRTLQTVAGSAAMNSRVTLDGSSADAAVRMAKTSGVITPGQGMSEDEYLTRMSPTDRDEYLAKKEARKAYHLDQLPPAARPVHRPVPASVQAVDLSNLAEPKVTTTESEGIKFTVTNGGQRDVPQASARSVQVMPAGEDVRRRVAKSMCADFPDLYDFTQPLKKKIARLHADFDDRPDVIRAVYAAESDEVKAILVTEFAEFFGA